jgi:hypothetical protein
VGYEISGQFETKILRQNKLYENDEQDATVATVLCSASQGLSSG